MGHVQQAVLEFDEEIRVPWRPRLVAVPDASAPVVDRSPRPHPSRRTHSRVGVSRPPESAIAPARSESVRVRAGAVPRTSGDRATGVPAGAAGSRRRTPAAGPRLRLTRRARRLAVVLALASGVALGSWLGPLLNGDGGELRLAGESSVVVQVGDTLWSIASSLDAQGDVRAVVDQIQRLNRLEGSDLVPGQVLQLP